MMMPKPSRSMKTVTKRMTRGDTLEVNSLQSAVKSFSQQSSVQLAVFSSLPWSQSERATYHVGKISDNHVHGPSVAGRRKTIQVNNIAHVAPRNRVGICKVRVRDG